MNILRCLPQASGCREPRAHELPRGATQVVVVAAIFEYTANTAKHTPRRRHTLWHTLPRVIAHIYLSAKSRDPRDRHAHHVRQHTRAPQTRTLRFVIDFTLLAKGDEYPTPRTYRCRRSNSFVFPQKRRPCR